MKLLYLIIRQDIETKNPRTRLKLEFIVNKNKRKRTKHIHKPEKTQYCQKDYEKVKETKRESIEHMEKENELEYKKTTFLFDNFQMKIS